MRLLGLDPGLRHTGWGVVDVAGNRLSHVAAGVVHSRDGETLATRLVDLFRQLNGVLDRYAPDEAAVEETFVNKNPASTLKLGVARGVVLLAPAERGIPVFEYSANLIKKSVVGVGHADKQQIEMMVRRLLPGAAIEASDAADALAVAICHAHHAQTERAWRRTLSPPGRGRDPREREGEGVVLHPDANAHTLAAATPSPRPSPRRGEGDRIATTLSPAGRGKGEGVVGADTAPAIPLTPTLSPRGEGDLAADAQRKPTPAETQRARRLRCDSTDVEKLLWRRLRDCQLEKAKFRRQEPILGFTADFVCHEQRLIVELDGGQHASRSEKDARRTKLLEQAGFRVLRFWNNDVIENLDGVLETIQQSLISSAGAAR
ncbi:MAG TPA: crossover junction endodeoxyribonuclease RuvC [Stellaceae bacterium]|nr:crossover junction endodeoxyribonuclease RuvC [Stellaceae bacterium]